MTAPRVGFLCYAIYDHPSDYPEHFVVRQWVGESAGNCQIADDLEGARKLIPHGMVRIPHQNGEDAKIVETWL